MAHRVIKIEGTRRLVENQSGITPNSTSSTSTSNGSGPRASGGLRTSGTIFERLVQRVNGTEPPVEALPEHHPTASRPTFINPNNFKEFNKIELARAMLLKKFASVPLPAEENLVPVHNPHWGKGKEGLKATWLGHAGWLLEFPTVGSHHPHQRGVRVLTDPIWSERSSPVNFLGPKRYRSMPCSIAELPEIDIICISHNHYDHCDVTSIKEIFTKQEKNPPIIFVPLAVKILMISSGINKDLVVELDWWDEQTIKIKLNSHHQEETLLVTCTPAQHNSGRSPLDLNKSLWCSWAINHTDSNTKIYFAGDTGYRATPGGEPNPAFKQIGQLCGPFSLGLIPIGNYAPEHLMAPLHCTPAEAMEIHKDVGAKRSLAMHWGTRHAGMSRYYIDAMEPKKEFLRRREEMLGKDGDKVFNVCEIGETVIVDEKTQTTTLETSPPAQ